MAGEATFQCQATGCWEPNALPKCIDEDLISSSWDPASSSGPGLWAVLVSVCGATALVSTLTAVCGVMACRKRRTQTPAPHWSTHVTVTPTLTTLNSQGANNNNNGAKPGHHQEGLVLPSYEEALREDVVGLGRRGLEQAGPGQYGGVRHHRSRHQYGGSAVSRPGAGGGRRGQQRTEQDAVSHSSSLSCSHTGPLYTIQQHARDQHNLHQGITTIQPGIIASKMFDTSANRSVNFVTLITLDTL